MTQGCDVLAGDALWSVEQGDAVAFLSGLPDDSIDLLVTSPPYPKARTYSMGFKMTPEEWTAWMVSVVRAAQPKVKGLIAINCEGFTEDYAYHPAPSMLETDLYRAGFNVRKGVAYHRNGIPGSGGPDWLRNCWEPIVCVTRPGRLAWSDNTACGHPPKWAPGGEMSYMLSNGTRVNQWGKRGVNTAVGAAAPGERPTTLPGKRPSHVVMTKKMYSRNQNGSRDEDEHYVPPVLANPGNVLRLDVGGGMMGNDLAHENEAPFPVELPAFFVKSFCPPGGVVCDPFAGSGSTLQAAIENGRRGIGCDIRESQVTLSRRRLRGVTPSMV